MEAPAASALTGHSLVNGIRRYAAADVWRLRSIKHVQQSDFCMKCMSGMQREPRNSGEGTWSRLNSSG
jgi:hypothetical protein